MNLYESTGHLIEVQGCENAANNRLVYFKNPVKKILQ